MNSVVAHPTSVTNLQIMAAETCGFVPVLFNGF